ncbi:MAG: helix-hairpin-helix domain-containing protein [Deltaproteobacteria bacterium]|nr:helix-hairpin-helix domain-containing protein [Deltaproteobacteria bacterium]MBW2069307.1 helix-hairpin-helix domain-containing protein [Deltaproteobacteria bacterium]
MRLNCNKTIFAAMIALLTIFVMTCPTLAQNKAVQKQEKAQTQQVQQSEQAKLNINTATQADLEKLPGIGPVLAERIIKYREEHGPFKTIDEIQNVKGIGKKKFETIKDLIAVE